METEFSPWRGSLALNSGLSLFSKAVFSHTPNLAHTGKTLEDKTNPLHVLFNQIASGWLQICTTELCTDSYVLLTI